MIAALKVEFPDMEISILTGYREFDYCQKAIRLGISRFLLKPSNMTELEEALKAMTGCLRKKEITGEEAAQESALVAGSFVVKNALQYIGEHYNEKITLTQVAEKTYVSQWHLSKLLNKEEGKNFSEILNCIRIRHAKELMKKPAYRLADIAELVGFTDVTHFSRVFKKMKGFLQMNTEIQNFESLKFV